MPDGKLKQNWWDEFLWNILFRGTEPVRTKAKAGGMPTPRTTALLQSPEAKKRLDWQWLVRQFGAENLPAMLGVPSAEKKEPDWITELQKKLDALAAERAELENQLLKRQLGEPTAGARELATRQAEAEVLRLQQMLGIGLPQTQRRGEDERAAIFEEVRQMWLSKLTEPADWIKRWMAEHEPNPFVREPMSQLEEKQLELEQSQAEQTRWLEMAKQLPKPSFAGTAELTTRQQLAQIVPQALKTSAERIMALEKEIQQLASAGSSERTERTPAPGAPPTPPWLAGLGLGLKTGEPIRQISFTPSAQQFARLPWSQRQGLAGFSQWSGQPWEDVLSRMEQMLPNQPFSGSTTWTPARQRR